MRALLVDDSEDARQVLELALRRRGHEVLACADAESAWEAYRLDRSPLVVGEFVRQAAQMVCRRPVPVVVDDNLDEMVIMADKRRMVQVLRNLSDNAEKYANGPTEIRVAKVRGGIELSVVGAPDHQVYVFSSVLNENRTGPTDRSCIGDANAVVPCLVTIADVRMPNQLLLPGDGSSSRRLMTVWPEERVHVVVVCVDPVTQELACPSSMLTVLTAVTEEGTRIGRLKP